MTKFAFIDFETTGLKYITDFPTEIGIKLVDEEGSLEYSSLIQLPKGVEVPTFITKLTGLTTEKLQKEGKPLKVVRAEVIKFLTQFGSIDDLFFVGHNINFDLGFLAHYFGIQPLNFFCTRSIEILTNPDLNASLANVYPRYFEAAVQTHRAMGDIEMTEKVFNAQTAYHGVMVMLGFFKNKLVNMPDRELSYYPEFARVLDFSAKYYSENQVNCLKEDSDKLAKLEAYGVDNWSGYSDAMSDSEGAFE